MGYWLAGSTVLYLIGRAAGIPAAIRAVSWATIGPVRRLIDGIVAGALVASVGLPVNGWRHDRARIHPRPRRRPDSADEVPTPIRRPGIGVGLDPATDRMLPTELTDPPSPDQRARSRSHRLATVSNVPVEMVVRPGDHMWALAEQRLTMVRGREVSDFEIAPYWLKVVANQPVPESDRAIPISSFPARSWCCPRSTPERSRVSSKPRTCQGFEP